MREAVIVAMGRSAVGKAPKGVFKNTRPESIASQVITGMLDKEDSEIKNQIEEVIFGCAFPEAEQGLNVARNISLLSGITNEASAQTVNRFCASGLQAIATGANSIKCGENSVVLAGGIESMSVVPMGGNLSLGHPELIEKEPGAYVSMGITAENVAKRYGISREEQDEFSYNSHIKALKAQQAGKFERQIIPVYADSVEVIDGKPQKVSRLITQDQGIRPAISVEALGKLRPVFKAGGSVTAGNASQMSDGSGVVLLMEKEEALEKGLKPLAKFVGFATSGVDPNYMGLGPIPAIKKVLKQTKLEVSDIDLFELNEAFASQALACIDELGLDKDKVNVNGGAIALGHPLGATGGILTVKLLDEMLENNLKYGCVSMCIGGGMGAAAIFETIR